MDEDKMCSIVYGIELPARALASQHGEHKSVRFFVATNSSQLRTKNQIHLVEFVERKCKIRTTIFEHKQGDIWKLNSNPHNRHEIAICYNQLHHHTQVKSCGAIYTYDDVRVEEVEGEGDEELDENIDNKEKQKNDDNKHPDENSNQDVKEQQAKPSTDKSGVQQVNVRKKHIKKFNNTWKSMEILKLEAYGSKIKSIEYHPNQDNYLACLIDNKIAIYDRNQGTVVQTATTVPSASTTSAKHISPLYGGKWSYHHQGKLFVALHDNHIRAYDTRDKYIGAWSIEDAHAHFVRSIDCNPNRTCHFVSGGDDGFIKIWDCRMCKEPVFTRNDHAHWVWCVRFNTFYDQFVLSSSSDGKVLLTNAISVSSEHKDQTQQDESKSSTITKNERSLNKKLVHLYNHIEDSVYCVEWSNVDPWTFASLSYDGRLLITKIPKQCKRPTVSYS